MIRSLVHTDMYRCRKNKAIWASYFIALLIFSALSFTGTHIVITGMGIPVELDHGGFLMYRQVFLNINNMLYCCAPLLVVLYKEDIAEKVFRQQVGKGMSHIRFIVAKYISLALFLLMMMFCITVIPFIMDGIGMGSHFSLKDMCQLCMPVFLVTFTCYMVLMMTCLALLYHTGSIVLFACVYIASISALNMSFALGYLKHLPFFRLISPTNWIYEVLDPSSSFPLAIFLAVQVFFGGLAFYLSLRGFKRIK